MTDENTTLATELCEDTDAEGAVVVTTDGDESSIGGHLTGRGGNPVQLSLWMLAMHIDHVTRSARESGGNATHVDVTKEALEMLQRSYSEGEA